MSKKRPKVAQNFRSYTGQSGSCCKSSYGRDDSESENLHAAEIGWIRLDVIHPFIRKQHPADFLHTLSYGKSILEVAMRRNQYCEYLHSGLCQGIIALLVRYFDIANDPFCKFYARNECALGEIADQPSLCATLSYCSCMVSLLPTNDGSSQLGRELHSHKIEHGSRRLRALLRPSCWLCRAHVSSAHSRLSIACSRRRRTIFRPPGSAALM